MVAVATVNVIARQSGEVLLSLPIDCTEPRNVVAIQTSTGTAFKRIQDTDTEINIFVGEDTTTPDPPELFSVDELKKQADAREKLRERILKEHHKAAEVPEDDKKK